MGIYWYVRVYLGIHGYVLVSQMKKMANLGAGEWREILLNGDIYFALGFQTWSIPAALWHGQPFHVLTHVGYVWVFIDMYYYIWVGMGIYGYV